MLLQQNCKLRDEVNTMKAKLNEMSLHHGAQDGRETRH